jgi:hypothetical protein
MTKLPAVLLTPELKKQIAQKKVRGAVETLRDNLQTAGVSERTMFELDVLTTFIDEEMK